MLGVLRRATCNASCKVKLNPAKMRLPAGGISPSETHVVAAARVLLREIGVVFSSDDLQLVRDEGVSITLSDGKKQRVLVFSASSPSHFLASNLRTAAKIEAGAVEKAVPNALRCIFIGYCDESAGYWIMNLVTGKLIRTIHVAFDESQDAHVLQPTPASLSASNGSQPSNVNPRGGN
jgi:hypothetical protein